MMSSDQPTIQKPNTYCVRTLILVQGEVIGPPVPSYWVGEVQIGAAAGPTPPVVFVPMFTLDEEIFFFCFVVNVVTVVAFDVGIDNRNHFTTLERMEYID